MICDNKNVDDNINLRIFISLTSLNSYKIWQWGHNWWTVKCLHLCVMYPIEASEMAKVRIPIIFGCDSVTSKETTQLQEKLVQSFIWKIPLHDKNAYVYFELSWSKSLCHFAKILITPILVNIIWLTYLNWADPNHCVDFTKIH